MDRYYKHLAISGLISLRRPCPDTAAANHPLISNIMTAIFFACRIGGGRHQQLLPSRQAARQRCHRPHQPTRVIVSFMFPALFRHSRFYRLRALCQQPAPGDLFPSSKHMEHPYVSLQTLLTLASPATNLDAAKLSSGPLSPVFPSDSSPRHRRPHQGSPPSGQDTPG